MRFDLRACIEVDLVWSMIQQNESSRCTSRVQGTIDVVTAAAGWSVW
jgi:hypothetical protein